MDRRADVNPTVYYDSNIFRLIPDSTDPFPTSGLCMCVYWVSAEDGLMPRPYIYCKWSVTSYLLSTKGGLISRPYIYY